MADAPNNLQEINRIIHAEEISNLEGRISKKTTQAKTAKIFAIFSGGVLLASLAVMGYYSDSATIGFDAPLAMEWIVGVGVAGGGFVGLIISLVVKDRGEKGARAAATQKNHLLEKSEELDARIKTHFTKEDSQRPDNLVKALSPEQFTTLALAFNNNLEQQQQLLLLATQDQKTHLYQKIKSQPENFNQQLRWQIFCALENLPANVVDRLINVGERIKAAFALENSDDKATMLLKLLPYIKDFIGGISFKHFTFAQLEAAFDNYSPELKILAIKKLSYQAISDILQNWVQAVPPKPNQVVVGILTSISQIVRTFELPQKVQDWVQASQQRNQVISDKDTQEVVQYVEMLAAKESVELVEAIIALDGEENIGVKDFLPTLSTQEFSNLFCAFQADLFTTQMLLREATTDQITGLFNNLPLNQLLAIFLKIKAFSQARIYALATPDKQDLLSKELSQEEKIHLFFRLDNPLPEVVESLINANQVCREKCLAVYKFPSSMGGGCSQQILKLFPYVRSISDEIDCLYCSDLIKGFAAYTPVNQERFIDKLTPKAIKKIQKNGKHNANRSNYQASALGKAIAEKIKKQANNSL